MVQGLSESKMSCIDNKDGSCDVEYTPYALGPYDVNMTYGGQHIPGIYGQVFCQVQYKQNEEAHIPPFN